MENHRNLNVHVPFGVHVMSFEVKMSRLLMYWNLELVIGFMSC